MWTRALAILGLCTMGAFGACTPTTDGARTEEPRRARLLEVGVPVPAAPAAPSPSAASAPPVAKAAPGPRRKRSDPETFACGEAHCRSGAETCCAAGDVGECVASVNDGPIGAIGYLATQWNECSELQSRASRNFDALDRCDESIDCPASTVCCAQFLFSGSNGLTDCLPLGKGATPCDGGEICIEKGCRTPGTTCVDGRCRKLVAGMRCGDERCGPDAPFCCGDPAKCSADSTCGGGARIECTKAADCAEGERCLQDGPGTFCLRAHPDPDHAPWICERDAQCKAACSGVASGRPVCAASRVPWLKACDCQ